MKKKNQFFDKIITLIKVVCVIFLIILVAVLAIQRFSNNSKSFAGYRFFNVATGSMIPVYNIGDVVVVKEVDTKTLKIGDDITYLGKEDTFAGKVVTHRIINIEKTNMGNIIHTQGVANDAPDPTIGEDQVYGKVIGKSLVLSILGKLTENMGLFYVIIFIPITIIMFLQIKDHIDEKNAEDDEDDEEYEDDDEEYEDDDDEYEDDDEEYEDDDEEYEDDDEDEE